MKKRLTVFVALCLCIAASAQESVTWDRFMAAGPALPVISTVAPSNQASTWSIGCECLDRDYGNFQLYKPYLKGLGIGYARIQSGWEKTETTKGKYDFKWLDKIVDGLAEEGLKPWITLCYGNKLYASGSELDSGIATDAKTMEAWCKYVRATVRRYKGKVAAWEIWNEPKQVEEYVELLIRTSEVVRQEDPTTPIAGISMTGSQALRGDFLDPVLDLLKSKGKTEVIDLVTFHPYFDVPEWGIDVAQNVIRTVKEFNPKVRVCQGESGCPATLEFAHALARREWSEYSQAKWLTRRMAVDFSLGLPSSIFTFVDLTYNNPSSLENFANMQQHFGLLRCTINGKVVYKRPAYHAVSNMASLLNLSVHAVPLEYKAYSAKDIYAYGIASEDGTLVGAMLWEGGVRPGDDLSMSGVNFTIEGLKLKNPVLVEPITGRIYDAAALTTKEGKLYGPLRLMNVPIWDSPIFIMDASTLNITEMVRMGVVNKLE